MSIVAFKLTHIPHTKGAHASLLICLKFLRNSWEMLTRQQNVEGHRHSVWALEVIMFVNV